MIDFHTHILPGIDDGSRDIDETIGLLQEEIRQGVRTIVTTPHFYANRISVEGFLRRREQSIRSLDAVFSRAGEFFNLPPAQGAGDTHAAGHANQTFAGAGDAALPFAAGKGEQDFTVAANQTQPFAAAAMTAGLPTLLTGAEVYYFPGIGRAEKLRELCIRRLDTLQDADADIILIEMPFAQWDADILQGLRDVLHRQKLRVVLAHVERYPEFQRDKRIWNQVMDLPLTLQINGGSLLKHRSKRKFCLALLKDRENVILGSDCHNMTSRRPNLEEARAFISRKLGPGRLQMIDRAAGALLGKSI